MTASKTTEADDESVSNNSHADPAETTPKEHKERVEAAGAYLEASTFLDEFEPEITGVGRKKGEPKVNLSFDGRGSINQVGFSIGFSPDQARDLAEELRRQADYAEADAEYRAEEAEK